MSSPEIVEEGAEGAKPATPKSKKKLIIIGAAAGVLVLGGGGGAAMMLSGGSAKAETAAEGGHGEASNEAESVTTESVSVAAAREIEGSASSRRNTRMV